MTPDTKETAMFYAEKWTDREWKWTDGGWIYRLNPNGDWRPATTPAAQAEPVYVQVRHKTEYGMSEWGVPLDPKEQHSKWADGVEMRKLYTKPPAEPGTCVWTEQDDDTMPGTYESTCGELWSFIDGGPAENNVRFCHGCGKAVSTKPAAQAEPDQHSCSYYCHVAACIKAQRDELRDRLWSK